MKINDFITAEDWNALGAEKQHALRDSLRFMGFQVGSPWFPASNLNPTIDNCGVFLHSSGNLTFRLFRPQYYRISLEEVLSFIELTSFEVKQ